MSSFAHRAARLAVAGLVVVAGLGALRERDLARAQPASDLLARANWTTMAGGDEILALAVDPRDPARVWAGTEGGGVVVWRHTAARPDAWGFTQHLFPAADGPAGNIVRDIAFDGAGRAWLATSQGVTLADGVAWRHGSAADGLPGRDIRAIAAGTDGSIWAGGDAGVARLSPGATRWSLQPAVAYDPMARTDADGPGYTPVADIAVDARGDVWLAHGRGGLEDRPALSVFRAATGKWDHVPPVGPMGSGTQEDGPPSEQVTAVAFDASTDRLWSATWGRGVVFYDGARRAWRRPATDGLCSLFVWSLYARGGEVWAGCGDSQRGKGVAKWTGAGWAAWTVADGLPADEVAAFAVAGGKVWLGTNGPDHQGSGIVPFDPAVGSAGPALSTFPLSPGSNDITALRFEPDGTLWAGTRGAGLFRRAPTGSWSRFTSGSTNRGLTGDTVTDLSLRAGELWVAATQTRWDGRAFADGGVSRLNVATLAWGAPLRPMPGGMPDGDVSSLAVAPDGRVWIGIGAAVGGAASADATHAGDGVAVFDPAGGPWVFHRYNPNATRRLPGDTVLDLAIGGNTVWAATSYHWNEHEGRSYGGGVGRFQAGAWAGWLAGDAGLTGWSGDPGKPGSTSLITGDVRSVYAEPGGDVWAGAWGVPDGASVIERWPAVDGVVNRFDGIRWLPAVFPEAGWVTAITGDLDGRLWAGTTRGHDRQEVAIDGEPWHDNAVAGLYVRALDGAWTALDPANSGVAANAVTALAVDPTTGFVWVGTENGGLAVLGPPTTPATATSTAEPTATACPGCPTATRPPSATATREASPTHSLKPTPTPRGRPTIYLPWANRRVIINVAHSRAGQRGRGVRPAAAPGILLPIEGPRPPGDPEWPRSVPCVADGLRRWFRRSGHGFAAWASWRQTLAGDGSCINWRDTSRNVRASRPPTNVQ